MSEFTTAADALRTTLQSGFTTLPLFWPNDDRVPSAKNAPNGFVYSEVFLQDERAVSLANPQTLRRDFGAFMIYVNVPRKSKIGTAEAYAAQIRALFPINSNGIIVQRKLIETAQITDGPSGKLYTVPVRVEWFSDRLE